MREPKDLVVPILGGVAGGALSVIGAEQLGVAPTTAAGGTALLGVGIATTVKTPWMRDAAIGAAIGAGTLGGVQLLAKLRAERALASSNQSQPKLRQAEGDRYVTQDELNRALARVAEKQQCDLVSAVDEIKKIVVASQRRPRDADGYETDDEYHRNAYGEGAGYDDDARNADAFDVSGEEYARNAGLEDEEARNAAAAQGDSDEYHRNAYGDEPAAD